MKYVVYMHGGSGNRGCEAIVRTTSRLLNDPNNSILWSFNRSEDVKCGIDQLFEKIVVSEQLKRYSSSYFESMFRKRILGEDDAVMNVFLKDLFKNNIAFCVGGDNYCYPWSAKQAVKLNKTIRKHARATVLWGCSVDKEAITDEVLEDLKQYSLITAREQLTYDILKPINERTIKVSDPAFTLETTVPELPRHFLPENTVGINVSPMIMGYGDGNVILENYQELIQYIIKSTDMHICLIPHVFWKNNRDLEPLKYLYEQTAEKDRICVIESGTAAELKGYISRCRFFIGARTHSTIAAYSSLVPTLVVGYSIKSKGIARDLFGNEENYVLPVQGLKIKTDLRDRFIWLMEHENDISARLQAVIPDYIDMAKVDLKTILSIK